MEAAIDIDTILKIYSFISFSMGRIVVFDNFSFPSNYLK